MELCFKAGAFKARKALEKAKYMFAIEKQVAQKMGSLEKAKELGIISDRDFKVQCALLLNLWACEVP